MMTPYHEVYGRFLSKITDYSLLEKIEKDSEFVESILHDYLLGAIANFTYAPSNKLEERDDESQSFKSELKQIEIEILSKFMVVEYLSSTIISTDKIEFNLPSKDFNVFSPANLIKEVREIKEMETKQAVDLMVENYYRSEH